MHTVRNRRAVVSFCHGPTDQTKGADRQTLGQIRTPKGLQSLSRATDTLSTLLAQQVKDLNARQKAARQSGETDPNTMKGLKEATAVLKDLAAVAKTLNDQGTQADGMESGVVLLPAVEEEAET